MADLIRQLAELRIAWRNNSNELYAVDGELTPLKLQERQVIEAIKYTHHCTVRCDAFQRSHLFVVSLDHTRADERRELFASLDNVTAVLGPLRTRRRELFRLDEYYRRRAAEIEHAIAHPPKHSPSRKATPQTSLI